MILVPIRQDAKNQQYAAKDAHAFILQPLIANPSVPKYKAQNRSQGVIHQAKHVVMLPRSIIRHLIVI